MEIKNKEDFYKFLRSDEQSVTVKRTIASFVSPFRWYNLAKCALSDNVILLYGELLSTDDVLTSPMVSRNVASFMNIYGIYHKDPEYFFADDGQRSNLNMMLGIPGYDEEEFPATVVTLEHEMLQDFRDMLREDIMLFNTESYRGSVNAEQIEAHLNRSDVALHVECRTSDWFRNGVKPSDIPFDIIEKISDNITAADMHAYLTDKTQWFQTCKERLSFKERRNLYLRYQEHLSIMKKVSNLEHLRNTNWHKRLRNICTALGEGKEDVVITIHKDNKTLKVHANGDNISFGADFCAVHPPKYSVRLLKDSEYHKYQKVFGSKTFTCDNILQITYKKKTIYRAA